MAIGVSGFPASLDTLSELIRAVNDGSTTIGAGGATNSATTITVTSATSAPSDGKAIIADAANPATFEVITFTGKTSTTLTGCTRGVESSGAKTWTAGALVYFDGISALNHNVLASAMVSMQAAMGGVLIANQSFSAVSSFALDSVFTSRFKNYHVLVCPVALSASTDLLFQFRTGGVNVTATNYYSGVFIVTSSGASAGVGAAGTAGWLLWDDQGVTLTDGRIDIRVGEPAIANQAGYNVQAGGRFATGSVAQFGGGMHNVATAYDGFRLVPNSGTMTGTVYVFGEGA